MADKPIYYAQNTWNLARSIASDALDVAEQTVETPDDTTTVGQLYEPLLAAYENKQAKRDVWPFEGPADLLELIDKHLGLAADNRALNDLAKAVSARIQDDPQYEHRAEPDPEPATDKEGDAESSGSGSQFGNHVQEVAENLYACFVDHDDSTNYREIQSEFDSEFPRRSVTLTKVANSKGETQTDRIDHIAAWVDGWFGNPEAVREENQFAREPMGMPVRG